MNIFVLFSIFVPIIIYFLVPTILMLYDIEPKKKSGRILLFAGLLFFISWYLPSPLIDGQHTAFTTHFVGGGLFTGFLWLYLQINLGIKQSRFTEMVTLFALVSTLGVINELVEVIVVEIGLARIILTDTSWDLVANTLGAATFYIVYLMIGWILNLVTTSKK